MAFRSPSWGRSAPNRSRCEEAPERCWRWTAPERTRAKRRYASTPSCRRSLRSLSSRIRRNRNEARKPRPARAARYLSRHGAAHPETQAPRSAAPRLCANASIPRLRSRPARAPPCPDARRGPPGAQGHAKTFRAHPRKLPETRALARFAFHPCAPAEPRRGTGPRGPQGAGRKP